MSGQKPGYARDPQHQAVDINSDVKGPRSNAATKSDADLQLGLAIGRTAGTSAPVSTNRKPSR